MSRSIGLTSASFSGARVGTQPIYIPEHIKDNEKVDARCIIRVVINSGHSTSVFTLMAHGKLADICCKTLSNGRAIDAICKPTSSLANVFEDDGTQVTNKENKPIRIVKTHFEILNIVFGEESVKTISDEIAAGKRPVHWNDVCHQDYQIWRNITEQRQSATLNVDDQSFGYARIAKPSDTHDELTEHTETIGGC